MFKAFADMLDRINQPIKIVCAFSFSVQDVLNRFIIDTMFPPVIK